MANQRKIFSSRKRRTAKNFLLEHSWLLIPLSVVGLVAFLAVTRGKQTRIVKQESTGLAERFEVTTGGSLPPDQFADTSLPGQAFPDLGQRHISQGERATYNSNPPTSGAHYEVAVQLGIYSRAPADESLVHNLEHGGIIVSYNSDRIQKQSLDQLKSLARELSKTNSRIIVTPRANLDTVIALTAWRYLQKLNGYNPQAIKAFYNAHIARGPECVDRKCPI